MFLSLESQLAQLFTHICCTMLILYIKDSVFHVALTGTDPHVTEHDVSKLDALAFRAGLDHVRPAGRLRI